MEHLEDLSVIWTWALWLDCCSYSDLLHTLHFHLVAMLQRLGQTWQPLFRLFVWLGGWSCFTGLLKTLFHSVAVLSRVGQTWQPFFRLFVWSILDSLGDWSFSGNWQPSTLYPSYCLTWHLPPILPYGTFASFAWPNRHGVWLVFLCSVDVPRTQYWLMM